METMELIESYFQNTLTTEEKANFELRCEADTAFAEQVAFYITTRQALREQLLDKKKTEWKTEEETKREDLFFIKPFRRIKDFKWAYAAAAVIILAFGTYFFERQSSPQSLADNYIKNNLTKLGVLMDGSRDSMQIAITEYNSKEYDQALPIFEGVYKNHPDNSDALKDAGRTYLVVKDYNKALQAFDELSKKNLFSNPGLFYKALTLMQRNENGDKEQAKQLLNEVVKQNLEGSADAEEMLKKL